MPNITLDDLDIHYLHKIPKSVFKKKKLLYIHGTGCNSKVFQSHMERMGRSRETIAIDLAGHGLSGGKGFRGVADHAHICGELLKEVGWDKCTVAGHSLGGGIALAMALINPAQVSELIMIDTGARLRVNPATIEAAKLYAQGKKTPDLLNRTGFAKATNKNLVVETNQIMMACDPSVTLRDWIADDTCDFMARVKEIHAPTLAICGREDDLTPVKYHEYLVNTMPNCTLKIIDDAGHWTFLEKPDDFYNHLDTWLSRFENTNPI
jgi:pimeloyl-ACP methyl ester carboxylesterase